MRSSTLVAAALIGLSQAVPAVLVERDPKWVTVTVYEDVWTTTTVHPTPTGKGFSFAQFFGGKHGQPVPQKPKASSTPTPSPPPAPVVSSKPASSAAPAQIVEVQAVPQPSAAPEKAPAPATSPAPAPPAPPAPAAPVQVPASNAYSDVVLYNHNVHRSNHSAPALSWSDSLAATALKIAKSCDYNHNIAMDGGGYGQNIAAGAPVNSINTVIGEQFYNGEVGKFTQYGQATPSDFDAKFESYGHFTQVVWVGTTSVGCASYDCSSVGLKNVGGNIPPIFHVCNYGPPGKFVTRSLIEEADFV